MAVPDHLRDDAMTHIKTFWNTNPITSSLSVTKAGKVYFGNYYIWGSNIRGAIAANLLLDELDQFLSTIQSSS